MPRVIRVTRVIINTHSRQSWYHPHTTLVAISGLMRLLGLLGLLGLSSSHNPSSNIRVNGVIRTIRILVSWEILVILVILGLLGLIGL